MGLSPQKTLDLIMYNEEIFNANFCAVKNQLSCTSSFDMYITVALINCIYLELYLSFKETNLGEKVILQLSKSFKKVICFSTTFTIPSHYYVHSIVFIKLVQELIVILNWIWKWRDVVLIFNIQITLLAGIGILCSNKRFFELYSNVLQRMKGSARKNQENFSSEVKLYNMRVVKLIYQCTAPCRLDIKSSISC